MDNIENELMEEKKQKEILIKELLDMEWVIIINSLVSFLVLVCIAEIQVLPNNINILLGVLSGLILFLGVYAAIKIEQIAGYYECNKCGYKYVPKYNSVLWAMHIGRTRYMKCPKCGNRSWNKKRIK